MIPWYIRYLPNFLSLSRLPIALFFPFCSDGPEKVAIIFILGFTDFLDGLIARTWQVTSKLGAILDPIGDKLVALVCSGTFFYQGALSIEQLFCLFTRDLSLLLFSVYLLIRSQFATWNIQSFTTGKIVTGFQLCAFMLLSAGITPPDFFYMLAGIFGASALPELLIRSKKNVKTCSKP